MRQATVYNQCLDRQRLSFATCGKCGKRVAVFGLEGQDVTAILYENRFRLPSAMGLEIEMECVSCFDLVFLREDVRSQIHLIGYWRFK